MADEEKIQTQQSGQDDTDTGDKGDGSEDGILTQKTEGGEDTKQNGLSIEIPEDLKKEGIDSLEKLIESRNELKSKVPVLPESPEKYEIPLPTNLPVNDELMSEFKKAAHETGLTQEQAKSVVLFWNGFIENQVNAQKEYVKTQLEGLKKEWGGEFDTNVGVARKAIRKFGGDEFVSFLDETGMSNDPRMAKFCHKIGKAISESPLVDGKSQAIGPSVDEMGMPILKTYDNTMRTT